MTDDGRGCGKCAAGIELVATGVGLVAAGVGLVTAGVGLAATASVELAAAAGVELVAAAGAECAASTDCGWVNASGRWTVGMGFKRGPRVGSSCTSISSRLIGESNAWDAISNICMSCWGELV